MKKTWKQILTGILCASLLPGAVSAAPDLSYTTTVEKKEFLYAEIQAADVLEADGEITFKNANGTDGRSYYLDADTGFSGKQAREAVEAFKGGRKPWIGFYYHASQEEGYSRSLLTKIRVSAVERISAEGKETLPKIDTENPFGMLETLDFMNIAPADEPITRAEITLLAMRMRGISTLVMAMPEEERFADVPENDPYYEAICMAKLAGIVDGHGNGTFAPADTVTVAQAAKIAVQMLGYGPLAEARGGYPDGHMRVAMQIGLLDGLTQTIDTKLTRRMAATLMTAVAYAPVMEQTVYKKDAEEYTIMDGKTAPLVRFYDKYILRD